MKDNSLTEREKERERSQEEAAMESLLKANFILKLPLLVKSLDNISFDFVAVESCCIAQHLWRLQSKERE